MRRRRQRLDESDRTIGRPGIHGRRVRQGRRRLLSEQSAPEAGRHYLRRHLHRRGPRAERRARITFEPCSLESAVPNVLINDRLPTIATERQSGNWMIRHKFPARACFDSSVLINVQSSGGLSFSHALRQATLYRATLHLGTVFTESHETTLGTDR